MNIIIHVSTIKKIRKIYGEVKFLRNVVKAMCSDQIISKFFYNYLFCCGE